MPTIGDITLGKYIGYKNNHCTYIWVACIDCGKERWVNKHCSTLRCVVCGVKHTAQARLAKRVIHKMPPYIGEIRHGYELSNITHSLSKMRFVWTACPKCNKPRWVRLERLKKTPLATCNECHWANMPRNINHPTWKGGRTIDRNGYVRVIIKPDSPYFEMSGKYGQYPFYCYILEHRLVMAKYLGRLLQSYEIIHHKNGIRTDNRIENLELTLKGAHMKEHHKGYQDGYKQGYADGNNARIKELELQIKQLQEKRLEVEYRGVCEVNKS